MIVTYSFSFKFNQISMLVLKNVALGGKIQGEIDFTKIHRTSREFNYSKIQMNKNIVCMIFPSGNFSLTGTCDPDSAVRKLNRRLKKHSEATFVKSHFIKTAMWTCNTGKSYNVRTLMHQFGCVCNGYNFNVGQFAEISYDDERRPCSLYMKHRAGIVVLIFFKSGKLTYFSKTLNIIDFHNFLLQKINCE